MRKKYSFLLMIVLFLFIYKPPIFSWNIHHILAPLSYLILFTKYRRGVHWIMSRKAIRVFAAGSILAALSLILTLAFTTKDFLQLYDILIVLFEVLPISMLLAFLFHQYGYGLTDVLQILLNIALFQAIIAIIMFLNPTIKDAIVDMFYSQYRNGFYTMSYWAKIRVFGFASGMMFAMPIVQGFLAVVAIVLSIKKSLLYFIYVPPLLFSAAINARFGLIVFAVGSVVVLIKMRKAKIAELRRWALLLALVLLSAPIVLNFIETTSPGTAQWISSGIKETTDYSRGESTGYFKYVSQAFFLPETKNLLFGEGQNVYDPSKYNRTTSDIGYVNDLFLGGIVFLGVLYFSFMSLFISGRKTRQRRHNILALLMPLTMLLANIKGFAFRQNEFVNLFVFLSVLLLLLNKSVPLMDGAEVISKKLKAGDAPLFHPPGKGMGAWDEGG